MAFATACLNQAIVGAAEADVLSWRAGAATVVITPRQPLWMAGYSSRTRPAAGKLTELWAKALVLEDAVGQRGVLVTLDLVGIDRTTTARVCERLAATHAFERHQIALCCSHTHTGPALRDQLAPLHFLQLDAEQQQAVAAYTDQLVDKILAVVAEAIDRLQPARLSWGNGRAEFAVNRRENRPEADVPQRRAAGTLQGPVDHDVPVLAVHGAAGQPLAALYGYACHATVLDSYQWSGDYPGFSQLQLNAVHPEAVFLFWAGCGGDQNPLPRRTVALARHYGRCLAAAVDNVLFTQAMLPIEAELTMQFREIELPFDQLPTRAQLQSDVHDENRYVAARAKLLSRQLESEGGLSRTYPYPVATWQLGPEIQFVFLGGEVVVDYALRLKAELGGSRTWIAAYANDVMGYIPSRRVLREGGYEGGSASVYYGLPSAWAPDVEALIVEEVHRQLENSDSGNHGQATSEGAAEP